MASGQMNQEEYKHHVKDVYRTTGILSVVTIVEVALALVYEFMFVVDKGWPREPLMIFVIVMSLIKGAYIMGIFMHVKHEQKAFTLSILLPFLFLVWAIIAFLWEGASWSNLQETILNFF